MIQPSTIKLAKILGIPPEELEERLEKNTLNLGQVTVISEFFNLTIDQTIKRFFPGFMYKRSEIRKKGGLLCRKQE
jgi:hypothetical protein|nr:MAG TPA: Regulatory protein-modification, helix-turn-helix, transcriptional regulato, DNA [Caudoviricetes sp.]